MPPPMIGGHVTGPVLIWQSDRLVVAVRHVVAFPAGVEVEVEAHSRRTGSGPSDATGFQGLGSVPVLPTGVRRRRTTKPGCAAERGPC
jgi:hypothetical protein